MKEKDVEDLALASCYLAGLHIVGDLIGDPDLACRGACALFCPRELKKKPTEKPPKVIEWIQ